MTHLKHVAGVIDAHSFEFLFGLLAVVIGVYQIAGNDAARSMQVVLGDGILLDLWALYLGAGGVCVLVGLLMRWPTVLDRGFSVERVGLVMLVVGYLAYGVALLAVNGSAALATGLTMGCLALACWRRSAFLGRQRQALNAYRALLGTKGGRGA